MKKILTLLLFLILICPQAHAGIFSKKEEKPSTPPEGSSGYVGTLPDLEESFQKSRQEEAKPSFEYKDGFNDPKAIKPAPRDNPAFINIIMKKDKTSQYLNDLNELIFMVEKLQNIIEDKDDVQKFNAQAYFLKTNVDYFRNKYKSKPEESYLSFRKLMQLNTQVQSIAKLRAESEVYSPYVTASGSGNMFGQNNIENQLNYLNDNIKKTLVILKETR